MNIVIFGDSFSFPEGNAPTNRVLTYAKGFTENGFTSNIVSFSNEYQYDHEGIIDNIFYYHPFKQKQRSNSFLFRRLHKILKYYRTILLFNLISQKEKISSIIVYSSSLRTQIFAWILSLFFHSKIFKEISEHPLRDYDNNSINRMIGHIKVFIESNLYDGIFCISEFLFQFYRELGINENRLLIVPSTVEPTRFIKTNNNPIGFRYFGYFGGLTFERDCIDILINAFAIFKKSTENKISLVLGGFCTIHEKNQIEELINHLKIDSNVILLNYLSRNDIIKYILNSDVLIMTRSSDYITNATFPSKLVEYLATGNPVITHDVGEISNYIKDNIHAFIVKTHNIEDLADKLLFVYENFERAKIIAKKGQDLTNGIFNYNFQAKRILEFIKKVNKYS